MMISRRDFVVAAVAACATIAVVALADSSAKPVMHSSIFRWDDLKVEPMKYGARRAVFDSRTATLDRLECHVTTVNPGDASHVAHKHHEEEIIILKEGTLQVVQNNTTNHVEAGAVIFQGSDELHGLRNTGSTTATYYVVKWFSPSSQKGKAD
jgi:mannose-6-phosphate isomerase-like protein (cupin superfamily)